MKILQKSQGFNNAISGVRLEEGFYQRKDVVRVARELLGKVLHTRIADKVTSGIIAETEAYSHTERGCHAYNNRMTKRNEVMFRAGGSSYVYLCYGIHHLFNVVTGMEGVGDAVLIRALEPVAGIDTMKTRMSTLTEKRITSGPGKLTKAMGINGSFNGKMLTSDDVWIEDHGITLTRNQISVDKRIGIDYAGKDADLPWRFFIKDNVWVSKR